ncbi:hypothetical protein C8J56DRAFT_1044096 [Mycena floridula]|nr:hypothetical protein C8J56DRAFT_1044096 [Mycena floridula]
MYHVTVKKLTDPAHQFKVRKNAEQLGLTGVCIFNPHFSLVYVEGAAKCMKSYKRLMMNRIVWTEAARARGTEKVVLQGEEDEDGLEPAEAPVKTAAEEPAVSLEDNKCYMVWEGLLRDRAFSTFKAKSCPTDGTAKELLGEKLKGYWDQAKNWKPEEEELF